MSNTIIDFFHNTEEDEGFKGYLLRMRATENGVIDLADNNFNLHNITTPDTSVYGGGIKP